MNNRYDIRINGVRLYFLPATMRVPLKFAQEVTTEVICARAAVLIENRSGQSSWGWGETPLMVQWCWASTIPFARRVKSVREFSLALARAWQDYDRLGHPLEISHSFQKEILPDLVMSHNRNTAAENKIQEGMPWLAAVVCCSTFDIALHDAYGNLYNLPVYDTYRPPFMNQDLSSYLTAAEGTKIGFHGFFPNDFLVKPPPNRIPAWHLVGGTDLLRETEKTGDEPRDGYPVVLEEWIEADGLTCLKVKLRGIDLQWDYQRLVEVGEIALRRDVLWLSADFNCTVEDPAYVIEVLDRLLVEHPRVYQMLLYVEQPFPYDLEKHQIDVHSISARKPLFMDESAHDWAMIRLGRSLGWTGVALKTCKTQTNAILSLCWARAHGMTLMVQDLSNPMIAMIPHALLGSHAGTVMGVETNASQFYPAASLPEAAVHPGLYRRHEGTIRLDSVTGSGFGYRLDEIIRKLPPPSFEGW
jgi:L-alanine-DL-glutamate epimerase-like enolase superfamily enzyme